VQRRIKQTNCDRQAFHRFQDPDEIATLKRQKSRQRLCALGHSGCHNHVMHDWKPLGLHEHVLGAAESDALRAELSCSRSILRRVGVRPDLHAAQLVGPRKKGR